MKLNYKRICRTVVIINRKNRKLNDADMSPNVRKIPETSVNKKAIIELSKEVSIEMI